MTIFGKDCFMLNSIPREGGGANVTNQRYTVTLFYLSFLSMETTQQFSLGFDLDILIFNKVK